MVNVIDSLIDLERKYDTKITEPLIKAKELIKRGEPEEARNIVISITDKISPFELGKALRATWEEIPDPAGEALELSKYKIHVGDTVYFADHVTFDNGYVRFVPVGKRIGGRFYVPTKTLKEMWVRADVIEDPVFTGGVGLTEILLAVMPIAAMFLLPRVLR